MSLSTVKLKQLGQSIDKDDSFVSSADNLWDAAVEEAAHNEKKVGAMRSRVTRLEDVTTIFVLGNKSAGKTTLINRMLDKTAMPKPTLALDYSFARRTIPDPIMPMLTVKEVCNIWELGGDATTYSQLIETPIKTNHALEKFAIFIALDLSVPEKIWNTLETIVFVAKKAVTRALTDNLKHRNGTDTTKLLEEKIVYRLGNDFQDKKFVEPFPLPIVIIGTKYDIFQSYEPEKRKLICRILRLASHRLGASLNFFSRNDVIQNRRVRELFSHYAFATQFPKGICQDPNKALMIPHGGDSYEQIWPGSNPNQFSMDFFKHLYETQVGKSNEKYSIPDDPAADPNFREPDIDSRKAIMLADLQLTEKIRQEYATGEKAMK